MAINLGAILVLDRTESAVGQSLAGLLLAAVAFIYFVKLNLSFKLVHFFIFTVDMKSTKLRD